MYCPKCGTKQIDGSRFCAHCGYEVGLIKQDEPSNTPRRAEHTPRKENDDRLSASRPNSAPATLGQSTAAAATSRMPIYAAIAIAIIAVIVAAIIIVPRLSQGAGNGAASTAQTGSTTVVTSAGAVPAVKDGNQTIQAMPRPSIGASIQAATETANSSSTDLTAVVGAYDAGSNLSNVSNAADFRFDGQAADMLATNSFFINAASGRDEFFEVYESNRYIHRPSFVTVDSMMHTYHLYFSHLMKNTERSYLSSALADASKQMLAASEEQLNQLSGTEWENAARRNVTFFAVGASLFDSSTQAPSSVAQDVNAELSNIMASSTIAKSAITGENEDYTQYAVRGYYEGDPQLENYFRAMMWYGRMNFAQKDEDLDRSALLMTLALNGEALENWQAAYAITSFFAGESDDCGYYEYYPIISAVYGENPSLSKLVGDDAAWKRYHELTAGMKAPQINSVVVLDEGTDTDHRAEEKGYRFMGQRFSIDAAILQQLVYSQVGANASGKQRMLPNALDVPAALGSDEALSILEEKGETGYSGYSENMQQLRKTYGEAPANMWTTSLYSQWLNTLNPLLEQRGEGWPEFMRSHAWNRKNLQTYLGSYAELKHDTVLYAKQVMSEMGGGGIQPVDDRGYVEPQPEVYSRLKALVDATSSGLAGYGMLGEEDASNLALLSELAGKLDAISRKELKEETLSDEEYELIRTYGGQLEHFWQEVYKNEATSTRLTSRDFPAAVITDIATDPNGQVLEVGTGKVSMIYVLVPIDGQLRIASGSVYSFYQFSQPLSERLTDTAWRQMMGIEVAGSGSSGSYNKPSKPLEDWTSDFQIGPNR